MSKQNFFWSLFSCIRTRKNSVFGHFSRSVRGRILHRILLVLSEKETKLWHSPSMLLKKSILLLRFILVFFFFVCLFWIYIVFSFFADFFNKLRKQIFHTKNIWNFDELTKCQSCHHIETSQLIYSANQLTGFYMMATLAFNELIDCLRLN